MKAAVLKGKGLLEVTDFPVPPLNPGCVKIAVAYCGLCGTDLHKFAGRAGSRPVTYPVPLGHEASGVIVELGEGVTNYKVGDRVTVDPNWHCGKCYYCQTGKTHLCEASKGVVKGMAEYICPPVENVYKVPDSLSLKDAALCEPLACVIHGYDLLDVKSGETVAIIGCGAIGAMMTQLVSAVAGKTVVFDNNPAKKDSAIQNGADLFIISDENVKASLEAAGVKHIDKVIECVGIPVTAKLAIDIADRGDTVVLFGVGAPDAKLELGLYDCFTKELVIKFSYINPYTTQRALNLLEGGKIDADKLIAATISLDELPDEIINRRYCTSGKVLVEVKGE